MLIQDWIGICYIEQLNLKLMNLPFKQTLHYIPKSQHANELIFLFLYVNTYSRYSTPKSH